MTPILLATSATLLPRGTSNSVAITFKKIERGSIDSLLKCFSSLLSRSREGYVYEGQVTALFDPRSIEHLLSSSEPIEITETL